MNVAVCDERAERAVDVAVIAVVLMQDRDGRG